MCQGGWASDVFRVVVVATSRKDTHCHDTTDSTPLPTRHSTRLV